MILAEVLNLREDSLDNDSLMRYYTFGIIEVMDGAQGFS
jgi:hypothetical protein